MKAFTDLEQSKRLAEFLSLESADMRYGYIAPYDYSDRMYDGGYDEIPYPKDFLIKNPNFSANEYEAELPCWSLSALLNIIPWCKVNRMTNSYKWEASSWTNSNIVSEYYVKGFDTPVDACYELILKLHEQNLL